LVRRARSADFWRINKSRIPRWPIFQAAVRELIDLIEENPNDNSADSGSGGKKRLSQLVAHAA
jgi:hypothetical protein